MKSEPEPAKRTEKTFPVLYVYSRFNSCSSVRNLYAATAAIEVGAGLALLCFPSPAVALLAGAPLEAPALIVARVGGAALLTLGVACWLARGDTHSRAARGLVAAMVLYNLGAVVILGAAGVGSQPVGVALRPAVVLHAAMTAWCIVTLLSGKPGEGSGQTSGSRSPLLT